MFGQATGANVIYKCQSRETNSISWVKEVILVVRSQFSYSDGDPISIIQLNVDADPLLPRAAAEQHHLPDRWRNCNKHAARPVRTENKEKHPKTTGTLTYSEEKKNNTRHEHVHCHAFYSILSVNTARLRTSDELQQ